MSSTTDSDVRNILIAFFEPLDKEYRHQQKHAKEGAEGFQFQAAVEGLDSTKYKKVRDHLLTKYDPIKDLHFDKFSLGPGWKPDEVFDDLFEHLLEKAAIERVYGWKSDKIADNFLNGINKPPFDVTWSPIFRLNCDKNFQFREPIDLGAGLSFRHIEWPELQILKEGYGKLAKQQRYPGGFPTIVPQIALRVRQVISGNPKNKSAFTTIQGKTEDFRVLMTALFGVSVDMPFHFWGIESAWCSLLFAQWQGDGNYQLGARNDEDVLTISQREYEAFRHHFGAIAPKQIQKFRVTASRLRLANKRPSNMDRIVDYAVAVEGMFGDPENAPQMQLAISYFVSDDPKVRIEVFETLRHLFNVRNEIVHGGDLSGKNPSVIKYREMQLTEFEKEMTKISKYLRQALRALVLNRALYSHQTRTYHLLGQSVEIIRSPYEYTKNKPNA